MANEGDMAGPEVEAGVEQVESELERLSGLTEMQFEAIQVDTTAFGEGYEAGVKQISGEISRQIKEFDKRLIARWAPQDLAIKNHERRIKVLENRRPR